jgi:elongation factor Ts
VAVTVEEIKRLREETGAGVLDAKKALESTGGDYEAAVAQLRERGLTKVAKRAGREATEGRIEARSSGFESGLLIEVNCETDFVARNELFIALANDLADHFFAVTEEGQPLDQVMAQPLAQDPSTTPAELVREQISTTGENMVVRRYVRYDLDGRPGVIETYIHLGNRVGVMLEVGTETHATAARDLLIEFAHDLALHIAAMAPICVARNEVPPSLLEDERHAYRRQALDEGKPARIADRIVEGRLNKFYESAVLLDQPFVRDDKVKVNELLKQVSTDLGEAITVCRFARYELGEPLD